MLNKLTLGEFVTVWPTPFVSNLTPVTLLKIIVAPSDFAKSDYLHSPQKDLSAFLDP